MSSKIVGVLNLAPDSFSDGRGYSRNELLTRIQELIDMRADIIDVGAESTAPGSKPISLKEELHRLEDFFSVLHKFSGQIEFSLDTKKADIAKVGINHGITLINDVSGGRNDTNMLKVIAENPQVHFVLMYGKNTSGHADRDATKNPSDIMRVITDFFDTTLPILAAHHIGKEQIILDPGMGAFISTDSDDSIRVLQAIPKLKECYNLPILICTSRKGFLSNISPDKGPHDRLASSLISSIFAVWKGADYIRVHDVHEMCQAQNIWQSLCI